MKYNSLLLFDVTSSIASNAQNLNYSKDIKDGLANTSFVISGKAIVNNKFYTHKWGMYKGNQIKSMEKQRQNFMVE